MSKVFALFVILMILVPSAQAQNGDCDIEAVTMQYSYRIANAETFDEVDTINEELAAAIADCVSEDSTSTTTEDENNTDELEQDGDASTSDEAVNLSNTPEYDPVALALVAAINEWRIDEGLWPLRVNDTLMEMAQDQVNYLDRLSTLPQGGAMHVGANGETPQRRALYPQYEWPFYGTSNRVAIGENAYIGANETAVISYWQGSQIHRRATLSREYREIGIGVVDHRYGHMYIAVFGARPNVLPALVEPVSEQLFLSNEGYRYATGGDWLQGISQYQYLDSAESATDNSAWLAWEGTVALPDGSGPYYIAYSDGEAETITIVYPNIDVAWLPENLPSD